MKGPVFALLCCLFIGLAWSGPLSQEDSDHGSGKDSIRKQFVKNADGQGRGYSQGVVVDDLESKNRRVYLAGVASGASQTLDGQIRAIWQTMENILAAAGGDLGDLVTMTSTIVGLDPAGTLLFNTIRREILGGSDPDNGDYPASMLIGSASLAAPVLQVEVQAQAEYKTPKHWRIKPLAQAQIPQEDLE